MAQRRSPLRAAILTFVGVVVFGAIAALAVTIAAGKLGDEPFARGEQVGQGLGVLACVAAAAAYVIQSKRG